MKKLICLILSAAMALILCACSGGKDTDPSDSTGGSDTTEPSASGAAVDYKTFSKGLDDNGFFEGVRALDYVTLPETSELKVPEFKKLTDRAVEDRDFVNIDYVGSVDGVEFDGGSTQGNGTDVIIGVTSYIDDFLQQIIGHKPGENFDIEVTFPDNYGKEDLAGKDAVFNITVNYIWDITEELAKAIGYSSRDELANYVAGSSVAVEDLAGEAGINIFLNAAKCDDVPASVVESVTGQLRTMMDMEAAQYGIDADSLAQYFYGAKTADEYAAAQSEVQAKWFLIFQALAEREGLAATDEDITQHGYEPVVEAYGLPYTKYAILREKVLAYIDENVK